MATETLKQKLERLRDELAEIKTTIGKKDKTRVPLWRIVDCAETVVIHALHEAARDGDPVENATTYGLGSRCFCPHCGALLEELFDDVYTEGEYCDRQCPHCEAHHRVYVWDVFALASISLEEHGVCQRCFHWEHAAGKCEPHGVQCACQEASE